MMGSAGTRTIVVASIAAMILAGCAAPEAERSGWNDGEPAMDSVAPVLPSLREGAVLILSKTNGFRHDHIPTSNAALEEIASELGRDAFVTENAAVMNPALLSRFDVVVLNSTSGTIFTTEQEAALRDWIERGGGIVLLHGAGGDGSYSSRWYEEDLLGAVFIGHPGGADQFQQGRLDIEDQAHPVVSGLPDPWLRTEEWYAFDKPVSGPQTRILATLDEASYRAPESQRMGALHPMIWTRCLDKGRAVFSALGHLKESYAKPLHRRLIANAITWAGGDPC